MKEYNSILKIATAVRFHQNIHLWDPSQLQHSHGYRPHQYIITFGSGDITFCVTPSILRQYKVFPIINLINGLLFWSTWPRIRRTRAPSSWGIHASRSSWRIRGTLRWIRNASPTWWFWRTSRRSSSLSTSQLIILLLSLTTPIMKRCLSFSKCCNIAPLQMNNKDHSDQG